MKKYQFSPATFVKTAVKPEDFPAMRNPSGALLPEIAVAGRSNVGKSSLLNDLFRQKGLVRTSSTPGKTQALNFFNAADTLSFVDLPGYGYAEVPLSVRKQWGPMIQAYLETRDTLKVLLFLFDIRRMPTEEDFQLLEWAIHREKAVILVLTKVDKVKANEKAANTKKILQAFQVENLHYLYYSVPKNVGRQELMHLLTEAINDEEEVN